MLETVSEKLENHCGFYLNLLGDNYLNQKDT